ncbi:MAG: translation initiation factor IF-2 [Thermoanaerobaculum sp.]|nr:translation initiation factor IF-2 [Thermoanaerobaculum sp.]
MVQVFRVGDVARQMGVEVPELIFKLRAIGVEVSNAEDTLDLETVRAIIRGDTLARRPKEVIIRQETTPPPAAEVAPKPLARKPKKGIRRHVIGEDLPDEVPSLDGLAVPASQPRPMAAPSPPPETEAPTPPSAATPAAGPSVEEAVPPVLVAGEQPAPETPPPPAQEAPVPTLGVTQPPTGEAEAPVQPEVAAPVPESKPSSPQAKTPLEGKLRELSEEEIRQRLLAQKQAQKAAAPPPKAAGKKVKPSPDAALIRELLETFEQQKVRPAAENRVSPPAPAAFAPPGKAKPAKPSRKREVPAEPMEVSLEFRDGKKPEGPIYLSEAVTVRELAEKLNVMVKDLMRFLLAKKILVTANQTLPQDLVEQICQWLKVDALVVSFEEEIDLALAETGTFGQWEPRPPVVTIMGHVDHGKTTLLDAIRKTQVAAREAGGITQHIGASRVVHQGKPIVFIDTPGHEAFTAMRSRGAKVTDIVVLVVAADDGVMPQTVEAINHARAGKVQLVVAINKIDKPNANPDRVKRQLAEHGVLVEGWGGNVPVVEVSALKKQGITDLLEVLLLVAEMADLRAPKAGPARGTILEARKEKGRGVVATVLVQQGTLKAGDCFFAGSTWGRVRNMVDSDGKPVKQAGPSDPVEVMGFEDLPEAGDPFQVVENEAKAREIASRRKDMAREEHMKLKKVTLEGLLDQMAAQEHKELRVVLKADVQGSVEVLRETLTTLSTGEVAVNLLHASVGAITDNDIHLASASDAIVIGFNVRPERTAKELAERHRVEIRTYNVIYQLTEDIQKALAGLLQPLFEEKELGRAEVRQIFHIPKVGTVAGCMVTDGVIPRSAKVRLVRDNIVVWEGGLGSLRRFKDDVSEVKAGFECGLTLAGYQDIKQGDVIEAFQLVEVARTLDA